MSFKRSAKVRVKFKCPAASERGFFPLFCGFGVVITVILSDGDDGGS